MTGNIHTIVVPVSSGGLISGVGKYIKNKQRQIAVVAASIEGMRVQSSLYDASVVDQTVTVKLEQAKEHMTNLNTSGILAGIYSGACVHIARVLSTKLDKVNNIVAVLSDRD
jgi:cysteine synthase